MKRGYAVQFGERFTRRLFGWLKFLSPQPRKRDFRYAPTSWLRGISEFLPQPIGLCYRTFALKKILYFI
jgi:hypothetical protein